MKYKEKKYANTLSNLQKQKEDTMLWPAFNLRHEHGISKYITAAYQKNENLKSRHDQH